MSSVVPFVDLKAQYRSIKPEVDAAIAHVLDTTQFILGEEVGRFEHEFAEYVGAKHAVALNSGTSALHLALLAAGVGAGDEVITSPFTFVATVAAIRYTGAIPVFVDVDPESYAMDPALLEGAITPRTKAIVPIHLYGQAADLDPILAVAGAHGVPVIEDACQAHGTEYKGRRVGALGDLGAFSFYPGKNLGAYGEGGMAVTNDDGHAATMRMLRDWGQKSKYHHELRGYNYRMDGIQGAILRVKLRYLPAWTDARRERAARYTGLLAGSSVVPPAEMAYGRHVYHVYAVRTREREALQQTLHGRGVQTGIHYPIPVHLQTAHADLGYQRGDFPVSERLADEVLSLPMYPEMPLTAVEEVVAAIQQDAYVI
ncbi:MAG TPA: DegT/DnrJ/EryC1/StrS family aminotransferase [Vicinamibacterales bacterium]|nr:DegT/DnrJ/EryC1/StrS family aminotransferase [Vicinamibacterales bacterium]